MADWHLTARIVEKGQTRKAVTCACGWLWEGDASIMDVADRVTQHWADFAGEPVKHPVRNTMIQPAKVVL